MGKISSDQVQDAPASDKRPLAPDQVRDAPTGPSGWQRFGVGLADPVVGAIQATGRQTGEMVEPPLWGSSPTGPQDLSAPIDAAVKKREDDYQASRKAGGQSGADWARLGGQIASPVNIAAAAVPGGAATTLGKVALGAASGGATALTEPVAHGDYWHEKTKQIEMGLGLGAAAQGAASVVGKAIAPAMRGDAKQLSEAGVSLTPGQMAGSWLRRPEEAAKSLPVLGSFIRGAEGRGIESFNTAVINQSLEPIGATLPKGLKAGREAVDFAASKFSEAYERLLPTMRFQADEPFQTGINSLRELATEMPQGQAIQFDNILKNRLFKRLGPEGNMDGQTLKQVESELGTMASEYRSSSDAAQRQLAAALDETRSLIRQGVGRQNPAAAAELSKINAGYAMLTRVENAASRRLGSQGVFTPMDLLAAVRSGDRTVRHRDFAHGDALMQQFAETGQRVLSKELPDSGTTERGLWDAVIRGLTGLGVAGGAAGAHAAGASGVGIPAAAGVGALIAPYTRIGGEAVQRYANPGALRQAIGGGAETIGSYTSPAAAAMGLQ